MALAVVLLVWSVAAAILLGLGALVHGVAGVGAGDPSPSHRFWLGFATLLVLVQLWHFVRPADAWFVLGAAGVSALGWVRTCGRGSNALIPGGGRGHFRDWLRRTPARERLALVTSLVAGLALSLAVASLALHGAPPLDDYLYSLQTLRWMHDFAVVPGLGNLDHRLALNHAFYLYAALFDFGPRLVDARHFASGLLVCACLLDFGAAFVRVAWSARGSAPGDLARSLLLVPLVAQALAQNLSSASADPATVAVGATLLALWSEVALVPARRRAPAALVTLAGLAVVAPVLKGSLGFLALGLALGLIASRPSKRIVSFLFAFGALAVVPWMASGLVQSGYPLFPSTVGNLHLSWRVPEATARHEAAYITAFARGFPSVESAARAPGWLGHWLRQAVTDNVAFVLPVALAAVAAGALALRAVRGRLAPKTLAALAPIAFALAGWWVAAPDLRFALATLWGLGALGWTLATGSSRATAVVAVTFLVLVVALVLPGATFARRFPPERSIVTGSFTLPSGDVLHVDVGQGCDQLPCTRVFPPRLRLRVAHQLERGFESTTLDRSSTGAEEERRRAWKPRPLLVHDRRP